MSFAADGSAWTGPLLAEDARALNRLLRRTLGRGFRLVVIEVATPRLRQRIVEWLRAEVEAEPLDGEVLEFDVTSLPGENLWSELGERLDHGKVERQRLVLAMHGFQEAAHGEPDERAGLYRQLNVQRDLFVRDLGCFWVLLIDPYGSRKLQNIAPDFCDFASLWIRAPGQQAEVAQMSVDRLTAPFTRSVHQPKSELLRLAGAAITAGRYVEARDLLTRFELAETHDSDDEGHALHLRGRLELLRGNLDTALRASEQALAWSIARGAKREIADALHLLGGVHLVQGQYERARTSLEQSIEIKQEIFGTRGHPSVLASLHELARAHGAMGHTQEARRLFEHVLSFPASPKTVATTLHELASVMLMQRDYEEARRALERAVEIQQQVFGPELHPDVATVLHSLGSVLRHQGDLDAARRHVERAIEIESKVLGTQLHPNIAASLHELAAILQAQGDLDGARRLFERSLEINTEMLGPGHPDVAAILHNLAGVLWRQGDLDGAYTLLQRALATAMQALGEFHPSVITALHSLATLHKERSEPEDAAAAYERALNIEIRVYGPDHVSTSMTEVALAELLLEKGEQTRAEALLVHARPILADALGPTDATVQKADALLQACARTPPA